MTLQKIGLKYNTDKATYHNFCDFYEKNLNKDIKILWEIGILNGASLNMWAEYYKSAKIVGFDIEDKSTLKYLPNIEIKVLDQGNLEQLKILANNYKDIDVIIDDGSHFVNHQIMTFECLFNSLKSNGQYIIEDLHTSTNMQVGYNFSNNKGALQYLQDISQNLEPKNYPGQFNTPNTLKLIKSIEIFTTIHEDGNKSITAIITKK
ncbi:MAG: hypothetical protein IKO49_05230 [Bacilli bacterium]|nr:hypothetical protein [Bacilli bacterium]